MQCLKICRRLYRVYLTIEDTTKIPTAEPANAMAQAKARLRLVCCWTVTTDDIAIMPNPRPKITRSLALIIKMTMKLYIRCLFVYISVSLSTYKSVYKFCLHSTYVQPSVRNRVKHLGGGGVFLSNIFWSYLKFSKMPGSFAHLGGGALTPPPHFDHWPSL